MSTTKQKINRCVVCKLEWLKTLSTHISRNRLKEVQERIRQTPVTRLSVCDEHFPKMLELKRALQVLRYTDKVNEFIFLQEVSNDVKKQITRVMEMTEAGVTGIKLATEQKIAREYVAVMYRQLRRVNKLYGKHLKMADASTLTDLIRQTKGYSKKFINAFNGEPMSKRFVASMHGAKNDTVIRSLSKDYNPDDYILGDEELPV